MDYLGEYEFNHIGSTIKYGISSNDDFHCATFDYKKIKVTMFWFDSKRFRHYNIVSYLCSIIDKIESQQQFDEFKRNYDELDALVDKYIVVGDKVYYPKITDKTKEVISPCIIMNIDFVDNSNLFELKIDVRNKFAVAYEFIEKAKNEIKVRKTEPTDVYINMSQTEKYNKLIDWFSSNNLHIMI